MAKTTIENEWRERFETVWDKGNYRLGSPGQRMIKYFIQHQQDGQTVNDYGSGTGRAIVELLSYKPTTRVNMVDIARNAMEEPCRELLVTRPGQVTFTLAPLWNLPKDFPVSDWGLCIEVLCFVPADKLDACLSEIRRTCNALFVQVYDWQDRRCGYDLTTVQAPDFWWQEKLREHWKHIEQIPHPETPRRFLFVCR